MQQQKKLFKFIYSLNMRIVCGGGGGAEKSSPAKMMRIPNTCTYFLSQVVEQMLLMQNVRQARRKKSVITRNHSWEFHQVTTIYFFFEGDTCNLRACAPSIHQHTFYDMQLKFQFNDYISSDIRLMPDERDKPFWLHCERQRFFFGSILHVFIAMNQMRYTHRKKMYSYEHTYNDFDGR